MTEKSISAPQFFSLLYLSMLGTLFMYISSADIKIASTDSILRPIVFVGVNLIAIIPSYLFIKRQRKSRLSYGQSLQGNIVFKIVAVCYGAVYFLDAIMTSSRFDLFASSELFPGTDMTFFILGLVAVCGALALLGIGALARAGIVFTVIVTGATIFAMLTLIEEVDFLNFTPLFEFGAEDFLKDSLIFSAHATGIGAVVIFSENIREKLLKNYILWVVLSGIIFVFILFFVVGTLGLFADTQLFPTYAAISLAKFGLLERLDALETAIWILCVVSKLTLYMIIVIKCVAYIFPKASKTLISACLSIIIGFVLVFISGDVKRFGFLSSVPLNVVLYIIPVVVLPIILIISDAVKRGLKRARNA